MCQQLTFDLSLDLKHSLYIKELKDRLKVLQEKSIEEIGEKEVELVEEKCENLIKTELGLAEQAENIKKSERKIDRTKARVIFQRNTRNTIVLSQSPQRGIAASKKKIRMFT